MKDLTGVVAIVPFDQECIDSTLACIHSFKDKLGKLIIIQNGIKHPVPDKLIKQADVYLTNRHNIKHAGAVNQATGLVTTKYIAFIDNGITDKNVNFETLCSECSISSPVIMHNEAPQDAEFGAHASFFVTTKDIMQRVGEWIDTQDADMDWFQRAKDLGISMRQLNDQFVIHHVAGMTRQKLIYYGDI